jgi:predicted signal transduction protein with EAL and GGDEF domain
VSVAAVVVASALAAFWAVHFVRVTDAWLSVGHLLLITAPLVVVLSAWLRREHAERRADKALDAELTRSPLPLRPLGEDHARGGELG